MAQLIEELLAKPAVAALSAIGSLYVLSKVFGFYRLLASLFILPGKSVSIDSNCYQTAF